VAAERGHLKVLTLVRSELAAGRAPLTHGGVLGQVWRGGADLRPLALAARVHVDLVPV
jgi:hypothetical protein